MLSLDGGRLSLEQIFEVACGGEQVDVSEVAMQRMYASRRAIEDILRSGRVVYGVNTGFGKLADVTVPGNQLEQLQLNLVRSHACGVGQPLSEAETRAMMLLRANVLALGFSGARPEIAQRLAAMLNARLWPHVPEQGSVGASGDLAPLAHLALTIIGEGHCLIEGGRIPAATALREARLEPLRLAAKEGLALLNGTQAICAVGGLALLRADRVSRAADVAGAMSLDALKGTPDAFDPRIHEARPQRCQAEVAANLWQLLDGSEIRESHRVGDHRVQDAYSLRCMPQVHGAARAALAYAREALETETASATDNPLVFPNGDVVSGGNFHGAPLALALDFAAIALVDLMSICERRIDRMMNPDLSDGLPPFLATAPGLESGMMLAHVTAVALLSESRVLAHPASVDNATTSACKEDHVSMGMTSATKFRRIVENAERCIAIELIAAAQGLEFRRPLRSSARLERVHSELRLLSPELSADRSLSEDIERVAGAIRHGASLLG